MSTNPVQMVRSALETRLQSQLDCVGQPDAAPAEWQDLSEELEIRDPRRLRMLVALGIRAETASAFQALPFVGVAWADGAVDTEERWRVIALATRFGLELGRPCHAQLELWLRRKPEPELFEAWLDCAGEWRDQSDFVQQAARIVSGSAEVGATAGGWLGLGAISKSEQQRIDQVADALGVPRPT